MRYIFIIGLFLFGCKTTNEIVQAGGQGTIVILIQYSEGHDAEENVLQLLHSLSNVQHFDVRSRNSFTEEIEATCFSMKDTNLDNLQNQLKQTSGVFNVVVNPRN